MLPQPLFWNVHMYGVMIAVGIGACFLVLFGYGKILKMKIDFLDFVFYNAIVAIFVGFGSASVFQGVYNYIENPEAGFHLDGGITFIGGLIGGVLSFLVGYFIFRRKLSARLMDLLPLAPCCITVAHAFGRVGCFFAGCCYGKATDSIFGVLFPPESIAPSAYRVHPTQLYEAAFLFALFGLLSFLVLKFKFKHNMSIYLIAYGVFRFCIEYLRADDRGELVAGISPSQFWSLAMIVVGVAMIVIWESIEHMKQEKTVG